MPQLNPFTNTKGETFSITLEEPSVPAEADYWGFYFVAIDSQNRKHAFRFVVTKSFITQRDDAKRFAFDEPLAMLHGLLNNVTDGRGPLFFPDLSKGWVVF